MEKNNITDLESQLKYLDKNRSTLSKEQVDKIAAFKSEKSWKDLNHTIRDKSKFENYDELEKEVISIYRNLIINEILSNENSEHE